jgi:peptidyl-prolyl cis-trans isomerase SurA
VKTSTEHPADLANMTDFFMTRFPNVLRCLTVSLCCAGACVAMSQTLKPLPGGVGAGLSVRTPPPALAPKESSRASDFIVAVVDNEPITNQEVTRLAAMADPAAAKLGRSNLLMEAMETLIDEAAQIGVAKLYGMQISADELDKAIEKTAQRNQLNIQQLQQRLKEQGLSWEQYRIQVRRQMLLQRVREREVNARIRIQDFEIDAFLQERNNAASPNADINIAHIMFPLAENASADDVAKQLTKADEVMRKLKAGEDFSKLAAQFSSAADRSNGGVLGLRPLSRYPSLFVEATKDTAVGQLAGPLRSPAGFHVLKVLERRSADALPATVTQTRSRHILLRPGGNLSQDAARAQLAGFKRKIELGTAEFEALAKEHSQDGSANQGGDLGWANPGMMVPEFEEAMAKLAPGQVGDPLVSRFGVHLLQVLERREAPLSLREQQDLVRNILREKKFEEAYKNWEREVRGRAFIEYRETPQ